MPGTITPFLTIDQGRSPDPSRPGPRQQVQQSCEGVNMWGAGGVILKGK